VSKRFIVKVQISLSTSESTPQALIYDEKRSIYQQFEAFSKLQRKVGAQMKRFFWAHIGKNKMLHLDSYAPEQEW